MLSLPLLRFSFFYVSGKQLHNDSVYVWQTIQVQSKRTECMLESELSLTGKYIFLVIFDKTIPSWSNSGAQRYLASQTMVGSFRCPTRSCSHPPYLAIFTSLPTIVFQRNKLMFAHGIMGYLVHFHHSRR